MSNVISISGKPPSVLGEPRKELIDMLENLLSMARDGKLQSLIATGFVSNGDRIGIWADYHENVYEMMGALAWLQAEYTERHT